MVHEKHRRGMQVTNEPKDAPIKNNKRKRSNSISEQEPPSKKQRLNASQVAAWMRITLPTDLQLYADVFEREDITEEVLVTLNDSDLQALGVGKFGHRKRILLLIKSNYSTT